MLASISMPTLAQDEQPESDEATMKLEDINVYGRKQNEEQEYLEDSFQKTYSRDKIYAEDLKSDFVLDVKSALKDIPNVVVTESGAFSKNIQIRGFSGDRVVYIIDGMSIANQGLTHTGGGEANLVDIGMIESIEVIKGSPSVIYSPGATGGIINMVTSSVSTDDHLDGGYSFNYDQGYGMFKHHVNFSAGYKGFGLAIYGGKTRADDYRMDNQAKLDEVILRTNVLDERLGTGDEITDLGYDDQSWAVQGKYAINNDSSISLSHEDYKAEDISFTHGADTSRVFNYDEYSRRANRFNYSLTPANDNSLIFNLYNQEIEKIIRLAASENSTVLESWGANIAAKRHINDDLLLLAGGEYIHDEAATNAFSEQDYYAAYANLEYVLPNYQALTVTGGIRANHWRIEQALRPGQSQDLADQLVGVSGLIDPRNETALVYALGGIYAVNDNHNLSLNYSHTYRYPSLMERFAYDVFIGGGADLEAESADNFELGWKYADEHWFVSAALFYNKFDNFIGTKEVRRISDQDALAECISQGDCDPSAGDYDGRESDFFETRIHYINVPNVSNYGFEFSSRNLVEGDRDAGFSVAFNAFDSDALNYKDNPIQIRAYYKKHFPTLITNPWIKVKARYVANTPEVKQREGFDPFLVVDLFGGGEYKGFSYRIGIRNLFDEVYHEPYTALDGLKRSIQLGLSYKF